MQLYSIKIIIMDKKVKQALYKDLRKVRNVLNRHLDYFTGNNVIESTFVFLIKVIDNIVK